MLTALLKNTTKAHPCGCFYCSQTKLLFQNNNTRYQSQTGEHGLLTLLNRRLRFSLRFTLLVPKSTFVDIWRSNEPLVTSSICTSADFGDKQLIKLGLTFLFTELFIMRIGCIGANREKHNQFLEQNRCLKTPEIDGGPLFRVYQ